MIVQAFRVLVGRAYRGVNAHDQVPALPPISDYRHVGYGIWIDNGIPKLQVPSMTHPSPFALTQASLILKMIQRCTTKTLP